MTEYRGELGILGSPEMYEQAIRDNEQRLAEERKQEEAEVEAAAALRYELDQLDAFAWHYLRADLAAERTRTRITPRQRKDYAEYRAYARKYGWPHDDARTLFGFLAHDLSRPAQVRRLHNSIEAISHSTGIPNVTGDPIICALMRMLARKKKSIHPQNKEH